MKLIVTSPCSKYKRAVSWTSSLPSNSSRRSVRLLVVMFHLLVSVSARYLLVAPCLNSEAPTDLLVDIGGVLSIICTRAVDTGRLCHSQCWHSFTGQGKVGTPCNQKDFSLSVSEETLTARSTLKLMWWTIFYIFLFHKYNFPPLSWKTTMYIQSVKVEVALSGSLEFTLPWLPVVLCKLSTGLNKTGYGKYGGNRVTLKIAN